MISTNFALSQEFDTQYLGPECAASVFLFRYQCSCGWWHAGTNTSIYKVFLSVLINALATFELNSWNSVVQVVTRKKCTCMNQ